MINRVCWKMYLCPYIKSYHKQWENTAKYWTPMLKSEAIGTPPESGSSRQLTSTRSDVHTMRADKMQILRGKKIDIYIDMERLSVSAFPTQTWRPGGWAWSRWTLCKYHCSTYRHALCILGRTLSLEKEMLTPDGISDSSHHLRVELQATDIKKEHLMKKMQILRKEKKENNT